MSRELVVDGDGHVIEPPDLWVERMDHARWGDWIPHRDPQTEALTVGGHARGRSRKADAEIAERDGLDAGEVSEINQSLELAGGSDPVARLATLDADQMDAVVLYATSALFFGPTDEIEALHDHEFVAACQRAFNDWLAEYCAADPSRLFGAAAVPLQDIDLAVAEARRAVGDLGLRAVMIRPSAYIDELPLSHPVYDPFWAAVAELDVPVAFHPGAHTDTPGACRKFRLMRPDTNLYRSNIDVDEIHGGSALGQAIGNPVDMIVTLGRMLMGGVCERFPDLRLVFLESGGGWCATQLERMDEQVETFALERRWLSLLPSEYFRRQCYISFDPGEWNLAASAHQIGADRILWASDYPHPEYRPTVVDEVRAATASLSEADRARILGLNALEAYRLPDLLARP